jgi:serine/threonine protein kinase
VTSTLEVPLSALGTPQFLTRGGTAKIYRLPGYSLPGEGPLIYKEYKAKIRQAAGPALRPGLLSLADFRVKLAADVRAKLDQRAIWPLVVVLAPEGAALGIVIREISGEFFHGSNVLEFQQMHNADEDARRAGFPVVDLRARLLLLARFAESMKLLHELGIIFGDVSSKNVAFSLGAKPRSMLVDTDSARRKGTRGAFGAQPQTPMWEPPEALGAKRQHDYFKRLGTGSASELGRLADAWTRQTVETDVYKFGLMVIRVLDYGRRSTQNRRPDKARQVLRSTVSGAAARLLDRTLSDDPRARPTMNDWYQTLRGRTVSSAPPGRTGRPVPPRTQAAVPDPATRPGTGWQLVPGTGWVKK